MYKCIFIILWVLLIGVFFKKSGYETTESLVSDKYSIYRSGRLYAFILFLVPFIFVAFRVTFIDTESYIRQFIGMSTEFKDFDKEISYKDGSELYYAIEFFFKKYISDNPQAFLFSIALLQSVLVISTLRRYSEDLGMSVYVFVASALLLNWMCNGMRQFIVVSIMFSLTHLLLNRKFFAYLLVLLFLIGIAPISNIFGYDISWWLLGGVHQSAIILIPICFIAQGKALTKKTWVLLATLLFLIAFGLLDSFIEGSTKSTMYAEDMSYVRETAGTNPVRFLVSAIPTVMVLIKKNEIVTDETPAIINLSINMSFISSVIYLSSVFSSGIYIGRLPIYCEIYNLILIPWLINHPYAKHKNILSAGLYIFYFLYFLYQTLLVWGSYPYIIDIFGFRLR